MNVKKSDKQIGLDQMYLPKGEEWTSHVPVLDGVAVNYAGNLQVEEHSSGRRKEIALTPSLNLMERIADLSNLSRACRKVISNKGSAGIDGMNVEELGVWFKSNWRLLQEELLEEKYRISGVREVEIPKTKGGVRKLGIPTVKDRLVQQAIHQILDPIYDRTFSPTSYGFRKGRSAHNALVQLSHYIGQGKDHMVDIDMAKFFDEVNHERLMSRLKQRIGDKKLLRLIHKYLRGGIQVGGLASHRVKGTPQGSPLSPLLSNIVLDELDRELSRRGHRYVRYADDLIIVVGSQQAAERVKSSITNYIEDRLRLKVNTEKSKVCTPLDLNYLGHRFTNGGEILLSEESESRLKSKVREVTRRNRGRSFETVISELNEKLRGWLQYFKLAKMKGKLRNLDSWIRRRLRCYRLKQCKRAIGMVRFLTKLGVPRNRAWTTASNRKGWWRKSLTPSCHEGMNNKWFTKIGLMNLSKAYSVLQT